MAEAVAAASIRSLQPPSASVAGEAKLATSSTGSLLGSVTVHSVDKKASLYLPKGTGVLDSAGNPLPAIHIGEVTTLPAVPRRIHL
ncbi:hypothetical protein [Methanogenium cariaci]|uniref:hypothetical protein n=1 Tax=Methanogenium cariaci TaxID=2197 RepID=UPI00155DC0CA|nr:hypothetical protein [Methanogenium cariaci]